MAVVFNAENTNFEWKQSPVPEFSWHTSGDLSGKANSRQFDFRIRSLDPGKFS